MDIQGYNLPDDLYYEENHFWLKPEGDILIMGMDDFGRKMADLIVFVQLPNEGKKLKKGKKFAKIESGKWLGKVFAPVTGELIAVNDELEMNPTLINEDCYGKGWIYKIRPDSMDELDELIHGQDQIEEWVLKDIEKYNV